MPKFIETYHLTLMTLPISCCIILFFYLALDDIRWLWGVSVMIFLQWLADTLDGSVGRARGTGLIKWGYYMDHFFDYIFLAAITIGYLIIIPESSELVKFAIFALFAGFMVNSYLSFATTNQFRISYFGIGPTEIRLLFIAVNTIIIIFGRMYFSGVLSYLAGIAAVGLFILVYKQQKLLWADDMEVKYGKGKR